MEAQLTPQQQQQPHELRQPEAVAPLGQGRQHHAAAAPFWMGLVGSEDLTSAAASQGWTGQAAAPSSSVTSHAEEAAAILDAASPLKSPSSRLISDPSKVASGPAPEVDIAAALGPAAVYGLTALAGPSGAPAAQSVGEANPDRAPSLAHADWVQPQDEETHHADLAHAQPERPHALGAAPVSAAQHAEQEDELQGGEQGATKAGSALPPADSLPAEPPMLPPAAGSVGPADVGAAHGEHAAAVPTPAQPAAALELADDEVPDAAEAVGLDKDDAEREEAARQISDLVAQAKSVAGASLGAGAERPADSTSGSSGEDGAKPSDEDGEAGGEKESAAEGNGSGNAQQATPWLRYVSKAALAGGGAARAARPGAFPAEDDEGFASVIAPDDNGVDAEGGGLSPEAGLEAEAAGREAERGKGPNPQEQEDWAVFGGVPRSGMPAPAPAPALAPDLCAQALGIPKVS